MKKIKIGVAFSGGVDSTMVCFLLKKQNFYIETFFMKNWEFLNDKKCNSEIDISHAIYISKLLDIKLNFLNFSKEYWDFVFSSFLKELVNGETPNPDVSCNKKIKFDIFIFYLIKKFNLDFIATGHYSSIIKKKKEIFIKECFDYKKDQTYFLNQINKKINNKLIFPLSNYSKSNLRKIIKNSNFLNYNKKGSSGICFIGKKNFFNFIRKYLMESIGKIIDNNKMLLGYHNGLYLYTIGQRKNLFINDNKTKFYVNKKNIKKNLLYVVSGKKNLNYLSIIKINHLNFFNKKILKFICYVKIKHGTNYNLCLVEKKCGYYKVFFRYKQIGIVKGQYVAFYNKKTCLGGAKIC